jgi:hypothetical protein
MLLLHKKIYLFQTAINEKKKIGATNKKSDKKLKSVQNPTEKKIQSPEMKTLLRQ